jgi:hypothetical protein|tara:strand:+ start:279 stop:383 length:105 start_codon:yes stop_codon:yes gene_type:complete
MAFSPEIEIGMGCKEKKPCGNFGCPWDRACPAEE